MVSNGVAHGSNYVDFNELTALRREAGKDPSQALEKVAKQFEALFMQMMLKSMRDAGAEEGGLFDNDQTRLYQDMYDKQISLNLSEGGNGIEKDPDGKNHQERSKPHTPARPGNKTRA